MLFLRNIANTTLQSGALFQQDSSFSYTCSEDYQSVVESAQVQCLGDGKLSHQPNCIPKQCKEHPPIITNGRTIFHSTQHGSIAKYRCFPGFRLENNHLSKLTCQFGQWLPRQPPKCLPGKIKGQKGFCMLCHVFKTFRYNMSASNNISCFFIFCYF